MSQYTLALPAPRRVALSASKILERWALKPVDEEQVRREALAFNQAIAEREQHEADIFRPLPIR